MAKEIGNSNLIDTWASAGPIVDPDISKKEEGWQLGEQPPHEWMNWLQNTFGQKINHILLNGIPLWNSGTEYGIGAVVQHSGGFWTALVVNTNSAPSVGNSNWVLFPAYDNTESGLEATTVQAAIDELNAEKVPLADFLNGNQSLDVNGYQKLPGGLTIQWGNPMATIAGVEITFPITFPNAALAMSAMDLGVESSRQVQAFNNLTQTGFTVYGGNNTDVFSYIAIGY